MNLTPSSVTLVTLQVTTSLVFNPNVSHGFSVNFLTDKITRFLFKSNSIILALTSSPALNKSARTASLSQEHSLFGKNPWICSVKATTKPALLTSTTVPLTSWFTLEASMKSFQ